MQRQKYIKYSKKEEPIKIIPLGGCQEIGKNCTVVEYQDEIIVIDCGIMFPEANMFGVDLVIPDMSYIYENTSKIKAVLLTHGHEDHIGALAYLLKRVKVSVYGTQFTLALVKNKLLEHNLQDVDLKVVNHREPFEIGSFNIEMIRTTHSIADSAAILLETPIGKILHTGDFKIDHSPIDNKKFDFFKFADIGEKGLLCLLSDSTNISKEGSTVSEKGIYKNLRETFKKTNGRIFLATFASNIHRIQIIFDLAKEFNKKVAVSGRSMENNITMARKLKYLTFNDDLLIPKEDLEDIPKNKTILITTGTQGEPMSALSLLAHEKHKWLMIEENDSVIISASVIPGNERDVSKIINNLLRAGANVIYEKFEDIHVSGHGYREELKLMLSLTRPKFFIPVHGEYKNLTLHAKLARELGIPDINIKVIENGDVVELLSESIKKEQRVDCGLVFVDGKGIGDVGNQVIQDREALSKDGIVVVIVSIAISGKKKTFSTDIVSRGFVFIKESSTMFAQANKIINQLIAKELNTSNGLKNNGLKNETIHFSTLKTKVKDGIKTFFYKETKRKPIIIVRIMNNLL